MAAYIPAFRTTFQAAGGKRRASFPLKTVWKSPLKLLLTSHWPHMAFREAGKYGFYSGKPWAQLTIRVSALRKMDIGVTQCLPQLGFKAKSERFLSLEA